ncbi:MULTISPECIES: SIS domain-containing protein [unclassified Roseitalea]|uniref:SIS domain-containing protein n=1 Tax=unclassified Roseitalea TaxID=2639107 RepID=UPI00273DB834|nr:MULTISPECIES: SIS domain-containing protein [unclassified Roseitalea]
MDFPSQMAREIAQIPQAAARLLEHSGTDIERAGAALRAADPRLAITVARGSSDHAAAYLKYAIELSCGIPVASVGPSVASVYDRPLKLDNAAALGISQSGKSPDIVAMMRAARKGGALTLALTNTAGAPIAAEVDHCIDLAAGPETSVAATKSFVASVMAGLAILAQWQQDEALKAAIAALPDRLAQALECDWSAAEKRLARAGQAYVLGRGPGFAIALEMALKFKETSAVHAEAYSAAEVLHGPAALVGAGFPVLALAVDDAARGQVIETAGRLADQGADVFLTDAGGARNVAPLPIAHGDHPLTAPLVAVVSFYVCVEALSRRRGLDPDSPPHLRKVTETV